MRNVIRTTIPSSLSTNEAIWTSDLLSEIKRAGSFSKVDNSYKDKYRQDDIKDSLAKMYNNHCCYCESIIGKEYATYGRIEHLKPKSIFPMNCFDWNNLHWACEVCNTSYKKDNWDNSNPILDPCNDSISDHLYLDTSTGEYKSKHSSLRGITTINHAGLNRDGLVKARRSKLIELATHYSKYKKTGDEKTFISLYDKLKEDLDYPSVYEDFIDAVT